MSKPCAKTNSNPMADPLAKSADRDLSKPKTLKGDLPAVIPLKADLLPAKLCDWILDIAERMNCPADYVAIPAMVSAGALVGRRVGIRPQRRTDWLEVGNLWGCVVGRPGSLKSPAASEALGPMRKLETEAAEENQAAMLSFQARETLFRLEREEAEKRARVAIKEKAKLDARGSALDVLQGLVEPQAPLARRHLTSDATVEKLGEICAANSNGVMIHRDELLTLFSDLDSPEKSTARGFFLTGWSGTEGYSFDRIKRGTVRIAAVNLSLFGTTQPTRIASYIRDSIRRFDDGMVQRLQLLSWPDPPTGFTEVDRYPDTDARRKAHECYADLAKLDVREIGARWDEWDGPHAVPYLRFSPEAQELFSEWRVDFERNKLVGTDLHPALVAHLSKYRGLIPRLALVCHLANDAFGAVSVKAINQALGWAEYLESHAQRAYASLALDDIHVAQAIWSKVAQGHLPSPFTARDVRLKGWSGLTEQARIEAGLDTLVNASRLVPQRLETGGRPSVVYHIHPQADNA